jgi:hypothetical protein
MEMTPMKKNKKKKHQPFLAEALKIKNQQFLKLQEQKSQ